MAQSDAEFLKQLREAFRLEAEEHLQAMRESLQGLEQRARQAPGAPAEPGATADLLERIYRETHTLKGAARAADAPPVEKVCQVLEEVFSFWKRRNETPSMAAFDLLHRALGTVQAAIAAPDQIQPLQEPDPALLQSLAELAGADVTSAPPAAARRQPPPPPASREIRRPDELSPTPPPPAGAGTVALPSSVRVSAAGLEDLVLQISELTEVRQSAGRCRAMIDRAAELLLTSRAAPQAARQAPEEDEKGSVRDIAELLAAAHDVCADLEQQLAGSVSSLSDSARRFLRLPAAALLDQLQVLVHDLARTTGKDVTLKSSGGDVRLDRRILEDLKDILIHLLRNAVDHGLEGTDARRAAGKSAEGHLSVSLTQASTGLVSVTVEDDGSGVDTAALRSAAVAKGFLSRDDAALLTPAESLQLMFRSDISTSREVTEVSGRGLGMAIVREKVTRLGGEIRVESTPGQGTVFLMNLPSMRSTFRGVVATVGGQQFVLPSIHLARALLVNPDKDLQTVEGRETIVLDEEVLPLARLGDLLGVRHEAPAGNGAQAERSPRIPAVVMISGGRSLVLAVDRLGAEEEILPRPLGSLFSAAPHFETAAVTASGRLALVLDVASLMVTAGQESPRAATVRQPKASPAGEERLRSPALLIADDSITARMLLKNVLEASGFLVDSAVDGADAWAKLQAGNYDAVVSDVEMPRLNGFDLTARIRSDRRLAGLPVVLVTALASASDRERGFEAGASAYIVKSGFDQANLIDSLRSLL